MRVLVALAALVAVLALACGGTRDRPPAGPDRGRLTGLCPQCETPAEICEQCPYPTENRDDYRAWAEAQTCFSGDWPGQINVCWRDCLGADSSTVAALGDWLGRESEFRFNEPWEHAFGNCDLPAAGF